MYRYVYTTAGAEGGTGHATFFAAIDAAASDALAYQAAAPPERPAMRYPKRVETEGPRRVVADRTVILARAAELEAEQ